MNPKSILFTCTSLKSKGHLALLVSWLIFICSPHHVSPLSWVYVSLNVLTPTEGIAPSSCWLMALIYRRMDLDSGSGVLLALANRWEISGVKSWSIFPWLLLSFDVEPLEVFPLPHVSSSFWEVLFLASCFHWVPRPLFHSLVFLVLGVVMTSHYCLSLSSLLYSICFLYPT